MKSLAKRSDDDGATLIIVLVIVTTIAMVLGVVLSQVDTSVRTTVALRDETGSAYATDAAGQAAITQLSNGAFPANCAAPGTTGLALGNGTTPFYTTPQSSTGQRNAYVSCSPDTVDGVTTTTTTTGSGVAIGPTNTPTEALLTVGQNYPTENGVDENGNWTMCVQNGSVKSNSAISGKIAAGVSASGSTTACPDTTKSGVTVKAYGAPAPPTSGCLSGQYSPTPCTAFSPASGVPTVPEPTLAITGSNTNQAAVCQKVGSTYYAAFLPGKYTLLTSSSASSLSTPCKNGSSWAGADYAWFTPGVYYFDFGSTSWTVPDNVIGGTPTTPAAARISGLDGTNPTTLASSTLSNLAQATAFPGACVNPSTQSNNGGVEFVFGGASTMTIPSSGSMDICANYVDATTVPIALYGVYQNPLVKGSGTVSAESGCVATPGCSGNTNSLLVAQSPNGHESFHFEGYVWAPAAGIIMTYKNSAGQEFNWGVVVRTFQMTGNGSSPPGAFISLPDASFGPVNTTITTYSIRYINVWTCVASSTSCPQTGTPDVRVKVQTIGSTTKVLSWSQQR